MFSQLRRLFPAPVLLGALAAGGGLSGHAAPPGADVTDLSIEDLMNIEVVSTTKQSQRLSDASAAVFVITAEAIRRSGATNIPELLRMVPGVQVARIDANKWAVTARGFNGRFANKLLVLVDGRSVYTPSFSGVYWEAQDLMLEDIDRIEVIRGPGASLWGANAVNGIINIITRHTADTQGSLLSLTAGDEERLIAALRHGGNLGGFGHYRVYGKFAKRDALVDLERNDAGDDWRTGRIGFRADWAPNTRDSLSLFGDAYRVDLDQNLVVPDLAAPPAYATQLQDSARMTGGAVQGRWEHIRTPSSELALQAYYQYYRRRDFFYDEKRHTFDIEFQHNVTLDPGNELIWGLGYRYMGDEIGDTSLSAVIPRRRELSLFNAFVQDRLALSRDLELTLGSKLEHNDYTGWELQPSARLLWAPRANQRWWAAVSRAVRTPSRGDRDAQLDLLVTPPAQDGPPLPGLVQLRTNATFESETLWAYELGFRTWPSEQVSLDMAVFYHDYDRLRGSRREGDPTMEIGPGGPFLRVPVVLDNLHEGRGYGFELAADWRPRDRWRLEFAYGFLHLDIEAGSFGLAATGDESSVPRQQASLRSLWQPWQGVELDAWLRYTDALGETGGSGPVGPRPDAYLTLDLRLGWRPSADLELSLVGRNLIDVPRLEFINESFPFSTQSERSVYGQLTWSF